MSDMPPMLASPRILWDPLDEHTAADTTLVAAAKRREIRNILKSYVGYYDPLCELLQNAMDAVDARGVVEPHGSYSKHIWVTIDLAVNTITVVDNGIGFDEESFKLFLSPNISFKDGRNTRGRKGVGATYLAYGFNSLALGTRT